LNSGAALLTLHPHPDTPCPAITRIDAVATRTPAGGFGVHFRIHGAIDAIAVAPPDAASPRVDGLWRTSCVEAFVAAPGGGYVELNLAPSTAWQAYVFTAWRAGRETPPLAPPRIDVIRRADLLDIAATVDLGGIAVLPAAADWHVGLAAVIGSADGTLSYWALAHPGGRPDFHDRDCFRLALPAPGLA
jgi:hypothetical protein